ncbi:hypothetical protein C0Q70_08137 [Pomacea canaliculata]|uniref:Uncharacterized protein n=1 Tax=Pomacea canaliculata TaxID=400727 RepID=A0A2T7PGZ8_POMCA|nr:hypothetical protein C0Q70_08137 [Pomacea canaliculata]
MDRNCYCCGPGGSAKMNTASQGENRGCQMDVDLALSELDSLQSVTGVNYTRGSGAVSTERTVGRHGCRMPRERSLSESISPSTHCLIRSCSESSFESESKKQTASSGDISINVNACINSKKINSAPLTQSHIVGGYHLVRTNKLVRSHSIDNLELAKLKLSDTFNGQLELAKERQAVEQVATGLQNLQMV